MHVGRLCSLLEEIKYQVLRKSQQAALVNRRDSSVRTNLKEQSLMLRCASHVFAVSAVTAFMLEPNG